MSESVRPPASNHPASVGLWLYDRLAIDRAMRGMPLTPEEIDAADRLLRIEAKAMGRRVIQHWTPDEAAHLRAMYDQGWEAPAIAKEMGRSIDAVRSYRKRLNRQDRELSRVIARAPMRG